MSDIIGDSRLAALAFGGVSADPTISICWTFTTSGLQIPWIVPFDCRLVYAISGVIWTLSRSQFRADTSGVGIWGVGGDIIAFGLGAQYGWFGNAPIKAGETIYGVVSTATNRLTLVFARPEPPAATQ